MTTTSTTPSTASPRAVVLDESEQLRELACLSNREIAALARDLGRRFNHTEDAALIHAMSTKISQLTDIVWHAANLAGRDRGELCDLPSLRRQFEGWLE